MSKKLSDYSKEELIAKIKDLQTHKQFGLVWENKPEDVVTECENNAPVIKEVVERALTGAEGPTHLLIEGDNYHSLNVLNYTHAGKVDVIYIDPPYNTGLDDFIYQDNYVMSEDIFRHSKWLSFMKRRLELAKDVLNENGVIFISIDDNEQAHLKVLCDSVFGQDRFLGSLIWQRAKGGGNSKKIVKGHEYILCYTKTDLTLTQKGEKAAHHIKRYESNKFNDDYINRNGVLFYLNDDVVRRVFGKYEKGTERRCEYENLLEYKGEKVKEEIDIKIEKGEYVLKLAASGLHYICRVEPVEDMRQVMYSILQGYLSEVGKNDLSVLGLDENFDYPKPVKLITTLIDSVQNKDALILDFFAGSGTTGQAVLELNKQDGGNRQFILCTNNENNIAENITYQRIKKVTEGYGKVAAIPANVRYFKTELVPKQPSNDATRSNLARHCNDMVRVRENAYETVASTKDYIFYQNADTFVAVIFDTLNIEALWKEVEQHNPANKPVHAYTFSYSSYAFGGDIPPTHLKYETFAIPDGILEVYKRLSRLENPGVFND